MKRDLRTPSSMAATEMDREVIPEDLPPVIHQGGKSWASVAQEKKVMKKYDLDISITEGKHSVEVPAEIIEQANPLWEDFVIARFLETAPHIAKVHMIVNKIWAFGEKSLKLDVFEMDERTMRIRIVNEKIKDKVVRRGMWNIAGVPMVVSRWSPDVVDPNANLTPLWVHLRNVPLNMYSWEGLSFMTSAVGVPDHLHPETIACTNFDVAKIFVKADLSKELPKRIDFTIQGEKVAVEFAYPWLPPRCPNCEKWGHYETFCKLKKHDMQSCPKTPVQGKADDESLAVGLKEVREEETASVKDRGEEEKITSEIKNLEEEGNKGKDSKESEEQINMKEGEINGWEKVSGEVRRSPKPQSLKYGEVSIATPSRYSVLNNKDEKGEPVENEGMEEVEGDRVEEVDDINQSVLEQSVEVGKRGRGRPRQSKTNHRVVIPEASDHIKDMKRGLRKNH